MSKQEVKRFFDDYVFGFIFSDINREIALAKSGTEIPGETRSYKGGGNFLCALGLLCYTEFMGGIYKGSFSKSKGTDKSRFDALFNLMGPYYQEFNRQVNVYKVFRCGMAHEYFVKRSCVICMLSDPTVSIDFITNKASLHTAPSAYTGPVQYGIGFLDDEQYKYFFVVEQYFKDFANACRTVYDQLMNSSNPSIPSPRD
jgi:hypothetical protein